MKTTLACLASLLVLAAACGGAENLIRNGSFEEATKAPFFGALPAEAKDFYGGMKDSPFESWVFGGHWDGGDYVVAASTESHSGKQSCEIRCVKKGRGGVAAAPFTMKVGSIVQVSFWIKAKDAIGGRVFLNYEGSPGDGWSGCELKEGTYDWTHVTHRAVVPARGEKAGDQVISVFFYSKANGSVWIDDVTAEEVDVNAIADAPETPALAPPAAKPIPEPAGSVGYRVDTATALDKVFPDTDYAPAVTPAAAISLARNEFEGFQVIVEAPWRDVAVKEIRISDFAGPAALKADAFTWQRVDFVETAFVPQYQVDRVGLWPDPLLPAGPFTVKKLARAPVWITLKTPKDLPAGVYAGTVTVVPEGLQPTVVPVTVRVWDFTLPDETHLRTMTWLGAGVVRAFYNFDWSPEGNAGYGRTIVRFEDILLEHRLGIGGEVASLAPNAQGKYGFPDKHLERLFAKGMNCFIMGTAPNLRREHKTEYTPEFMSQFGTMLKAYGDHLREKGWLDKAYVYTYDEAPKSAWPEVKKISKAIRAAAPGLKILQCLNEPEGVKELADSVDVFDVYVAQYHKAGVEAMQKAKGTEVWLAICCYPMEHPNLFVEYPLIDARVLAMFCWKYNAQGFEYWSPTAWGKNWQGKGAKWPLKPWDPNSFGRYNGDGLLIYPGADGVPYSSVRLEALRDGFEDYEYLWMLRDLVKKAEAKGLNTPEVAAAKDVLKIDALIKDSGTFATSRDNYFAVRSKIADSVVAMKRLVGN